MSNCPQCGSDQVGTDFEKRYYLCGSTNGEDDPQSDLCRIFQLEMENAKLKDPARVGISGRLTIEIHDGKTGQLLTKEVIDNTIVTAGLNLVRDLLAGNNAAPSHIAVGTDGTAPVAGDTTLGTEVFRNVITRRIPSATQITFQLFLATGDANGNTLIEAGIFNASSAGDMLSHVIFTSIAKTSAITVTLTWDITISEA